MNGGRSALWRFFSAATLHEICAWVLWVPLLSRIHQIEHGLTASLWAGALFLSLRLPRFLFSPAFGRWVDGRASKSSALGLGFFSSLCMTAALYALMPRAGSAVFVAFVITRGLAQLVIELARPSCLRSMTTEQDFPHFLKYLTLMPHAAMGLGGVLGGLLAERLPLSYICAASGCGTLAAILLSAKDIGAGWRLPSAGARPRAEPPASRPGAPIPPDLQRWFNDRLCERLAVSCILGSAPLLMSLFLESRFPDGARRFGLYLGAVSIGIVAAMLPSVRRAGQLRDRQLAVLPALAASQCAVLVLPLNLWIMLAILSLQTALQFVIYRGYINHISCAVAPSALSTMTGYSLQAEVAAAVLMHLHYSFWFPKLGAAATYVSGLLAACIVSGAYLLAIRSQSRLLFLKPEFL